MTDTTADFFNQFARRKFEPRLENVSGTIRFDLERGHRLDHWFCEIDDGYMTVSGEVREADCVVQVDKAVFDRLVTGETSPLAAWLRNQIKIHGLAWILRSFERLYPGPPGARDPRQIPRAKAKPRKTTAEPTGKGTAPEVRYVSISESSTFVVSDDRGDIIPSPIFPTGFFAFDTRFLSIWQLSINGEQLNALSVDDLEYFETQFFLVPGEPTHYVDAKVSVIRRRSISASFEEDLTVLNHDTEPCYLRVRLNIGTDFADIYEIADVSKKGRRYTQVGQGLLRLGYERETFRRETVISSAEAAQIDENGMTFDIRIESNGEWTNKLHVVTLGADGRDLRESLQGFPSRSKQQTRQALDDWISQAPTLRSDSSPLTTSYRRSLIDLAALRYQPLLTAGQALPTAGLPWFMGVHGRSSILTSLQVLPFKPELASATLLLGITQGRKLDDFRNEEPGKIPDESRLGESAAFEEEPVTPSFGAADTTPLFVVLLDEYERWTGDDTLVRQYEFPARECLAWINTYADALGNGYIWYQPRNSTTDVENHCWKDSWNAISYHDGALPDLPRATCELQGYAYDAKTRAARLARRFWNDPNYADQLEREAGELKERFNRDFWIEDRGYYALALDPDGRQVDALASNIGHLLWSGIVPPDRAGRLVDHLLGPELFSGWGVRTLATDAAAYNPVGYHVGTVWPFDNSIIAWGLRRYGFVEESGRIAKAIIDASRYFHGRLPEAFAGYGRELTRYPVRFPDACSPYALSAGAVLLLLRTMLGLSPHGEHLVVEPCLPQGIDRIELFDIPGRWGRADAFGRSRPET
ncbi:glycogen debranching N-terminal domain-containing protein [Plantactinospora solaniradicis]|uniref:Glycogen debranching N-terminal domain-containing protein n=1 Tax=Plantactinospora solaniradicis TaxID=1723736 RepID=A0ABW1KPT9_9ACTN